MAHLIEQMAYYGKRPWHGLGVETLTAMTAEEALLKGGLNWTVSKQPIYLEDSDKPIERNHAIVRDVDNKALGIVGDRYEPLQNADAFRFFDAFVSRQEAMYHTVGSLDGGRRIWILAKLPGEIRVAGEDITEKYMLLSNSHDGSSALDCRVTPIRVVCANTLTAALNHKSLSHRIRHTSNILQAVDQASKIMGVSNEYFREFEAAAKHLVKVPMGAKATREYLERCLLLPEDADEWSTHSKRQLDELERLVEEGMGSDMRSVRGTAWGAYNVVTEWVDHKKYRSEDSRLDSVWFNGSGQTTKQRAFDLALAIR